MINWTIVKKSLTQKHGSYNYSELPNRQAYIKLRLIYIGKIQSDEAKSWCDFRSVNL